MIFKNIYIYYFFFYIIKNKNSIPQLLPFFSIPKMTFITKPKAIILANISKSITHFGDHFLSSSGGPHDLEKNSEPNHSIVCRTMKSAWFLGNDTIARRVPVADEGDKSDGTDFVVVLASASTDRLQLMRQIGIEPMVVPSNCPEDLPRTMRVDNFVEQTARQKATEVSTRLIGEKVHFDALIGCDTMVSVDGELIGKPTGEDDAFKILKKLSDRSHIIMTGVCIINSSGAEMELFSVESRVEFGQLSDKLIKQYIMTGEPMGRAGAYAIQGKGAALVKSVSGSFPNIIGLPLFELAQKLDKLFLAKREQWK